MSCVSIAARARSATDIGSSILKIGLVRSWPVGYLARKGSLAIIAVAKGKGMLAGS